MDHRPSLADRLVFLVARSHAERVYRRFMAATRQARLEQEQTLLAKIRRNADSDFGRRFRFDHVRCAADFVRHVPILRYEDHQPYIERVKAGDLRALFGPRQRVLMFALSSGTTAEPKYIPVTRPFMDEYRQGWNAFGIKAMLDHPAAFLRGIVQISSRMDESITSAGIPCGAITGLMAATQKWLVRKYYLSPACVARIDDAAAKYYTIMRLAVPADPAFIVAANPASLLKLARTADAERDQLIRDIHNGTLRSDLPIPAEVRQTLRPRLKPAPAVARRLEALVAEHGQLLPRHYWNLAFLANWTGGTMSLYLRDYPRYFGDVPVRDIGLLASEGRVSVPVEDGTPAGILDVGGSFFEFVPRDRIDETSPRAYLSHEVEIGQEYFVILTTSAGLYRYDLGDLVRVTGFVHEAPVIEFLNKGARTCSLAGEKLTERQVILAMEEAAGRHGLGVANFVLAPQWTDPPGYLLHVGADEPGIRGRTTDLANALDEALCRVNIEYAGKRHTDRLASVRINLLPSGFLADLDRRAADLYRRSNEQYKHQYLLTAPSQDDAFPRLPQP